MKTLSSLRLAAAISIMILARTGQASAQVFATLHSFAGGAGGSAPNELAQGNDGYFYGTTFFGGITNGSDPSGAGTVFKISPAGAFSTTYSFPTDCQGNVSECNGANPNSLLLARNGNFYGTTANGGPAYILGAGTVFVMTPGSSPVTLYTFSGGNDGGGPDAGLVQGTDGNLYGTTSAGGLYGNGTIFKISTGGSLSTIYSFSGGADGFNPDNRRLLAGNDGNLYGVVDTSQYGLAFRITPNGVFTPLHAFTGGADGSQPNALIQGNDGYLYGTTSFGGTNNFWGTVFRMSTNGALTTLYNFTGGNDGGVPETALVKGLDGNLYGTTHGGKTGYTGYYGTLFKITTTGVFSTIYSFKNGTDGANPNFNALTQGTNGALYGALPVQSNNKGTIFLFKQLFPFNRMDFNADHKSDYPLLNSTGHTAIWYLNGTTFVSSQFGPTLPSGWTVASLNDFNHDNKPDFVIVKPSTGQSAIWYLNGATFVSPASTPTLPAGWTLQTTADFNADGKPDYLLLNPGTGHTAIWYLNGAQLIGSASGPTLPAGWVVAAATDLNGDNKPDLLLYKPTTNQTMLWYLNGVTVTGQTSSLSIPSGWKFLGVGDYNGDNKPDWILYRPANRQTYIWFMNGATRLGAAWGPTLAADYTVIGK